MKWIVRILTFIIALVLGAFVASLFVVPDGSTEDLMPFSSWNCVHDSVSTENELRIVSPVFERGRQLGDPYLKFTIFNATPCYVYFGSAYQAESFINFRTNGISGGRPARTGNGIKSVAIPPYSSSEIEITPFEFPFQPGMYDFVTAEVQLKFEDEETSRVLTSRPFIVPNDFRLKIPATQ